MIGAREQTSSQMTFSDAGMQRVRIAPTAPAKILVVIIAMAICMTIVHASPADARGFSGHLASGGTRANSGRFAAGHRHGNDAYVKAASQERDRLLKKLKDICRGC